MEENLRRLLLAFEDWLVREELWGDAFFLSPADWLKRGESWLNDAVYVLVFDSSSIHYMLNYGCDLIEFDDIFESFGFYYEMGHSWNLGIYPIEDYDFTPTPARSTYSQLLRDPRWKRKSTPRHNLILPASICTACRSSSATPCLCKNAGVSACAARCSESVGHR
ncbi:hypothetical protein EMIT0P43_30075 [Pseudomonas jessenii]|uniref:hypothetical protein n=1 Tax=Pseudomonas jessenii TaxID=77298 RepID=UPI0039E1A6EC